MISNIHKKSYENRIRNTFKFCQENHQKLMLWHIHVILKHDKVVRIKVSKLRTNPVTFGALKINIIFTFLASCGDVDAFKCVSKGRFR